MAAETTFASPGSRSASSPCTSSTTTSCSRIPGRRPATTSSSGLVPLALLVAAGASYGRLRAGRPCGDRAPRRLLRRPRRHRGRSLHASGRAFRRRLHGAACRSSPGSCCSAIGVVTLWRSRRRDDRLWWRYGRRAAPGRRRALSSPASVLFPIAIAYVVTHAARAHVPAADLGAPYEDVEFTTSDGLRLEGLVHPVAERRGGDLVPRPGELAEAGEAARTARLRRPALRPSRRGRERGRPEPLRLAGRARHPRRRRVPAGPSRTSTRSGSAASASRSAAR